MISKKSNLHKISKLTRKGYSIKKSNIHPNLLIELRESLKVKPFTHRDYAQFAEEFYVFSENSSSIYLPRFWAIKNLGPPNVIDLKEGKKVNLKISLKPFDYQKPMIDKIYKDIISNGGSLLCVGCGLGKTFMSLYIAAKLNFKTLVIVHTSVLLSQWVDRIKQFLPTAKVGIIRGNKFEVEGNDICIAMLQTLVSPQRKFQKTAFKDFGFLITDETHHLGAPVFSRALPLVSTKYMMGLSATPERADRLENVFKWYLGDIGWYQKKREGFLIVKYIKYTDESFKEIRRYNNSYDLPKMTELIIKSKTRNIFIVNQAIRFSKMGRQVLLLSARRNHLKVLQKMIEHYKKDKQIKKIIKEWFPYKKTIQSRILDYYEINITTGLYIGQMKPAELEESSRCNIVLGTYSLVSEGTDIPTLNTLIMASPKKTIQQVVGRILRAETGFVPLVLDICDDFSIYTNQGVFRQKYYKMQEYHIDTFLKNNGECIKYNGKEIFIEDKKQTEGYKPKKRGRKPKVNKPKKMKEIKRTKCLMEFSDSD